MLKNSPIIKVYNRMKLMRILLDTNILILRENNHIVPESISKIMKLLSGLECSIHIHPLSTTEIKKDGNIQRRQVNLSKLAAYSELEDFPDYLKDTGFVNLIGAIHKSNDIIDNQLLYCVFRNVVDYLITEDQALLNKADLLGIERVVSVNEAISVFEKFYPQTDISLLQSFIKEKGFKFNLNDDIFNTLKEEYSEFPQWWSKKVSNRDVYAYKGDDGKINAVLVPKIETNEKIDCIPALNVEKILKICLFKVANHAQGLKLGERLVRMAIDYAMKNDIKEIYLTHFRQDKDYLIYLIERFGFYKYGENSRGEEVFLKKIKYDQDTDWEKIDICEVNKKYYPSFYDGELVKKHIVPIFPEFHKKLFPDHRSHNYQLRLISDPNNSEGNSIKKAYICNSNTKKIKPGDILLFYKTHDDMSITSLGTVESVHYSLTDPDEVFKLIAKRTVFSYDEVRQICNSEVLVILFNHNFHFINDVPYATLCKAGIVNGSVQTITEITDSKYRKVVKGNIDERFIINQTQICQTN